MEKSPSLRSLGQMSLLEMKAYYDKELIQNQKVDAELQAALSARETEIRIVVLGSRHCGKTTIVKSFAAKQGTLFSATADRESNRRIIRKQLYDTIANLMEHAKDNGVALPESNLTVQELRAGSTATDKIIAFVKNQTVLNAITSFRGANSGVWDNFEYFAKSAELMLSSEYVPSIDDCIVLQEQDFAVRDFAVRSGGNNIILTDVGSQNAVSRKFLTQFDDVHGCVFVASLADYALYSDQSNFNSKLEESFQLFRTLVSTPSFAKKPIGLVLSKKDIFEKLLTQVAFSEMFEGYAGDNSSEAVIKYIVYQFESAFSSRSVASPGDQIRAILSTSCLPECSAQISSFINDFAKLSRDVSSSSAQPAARQP